MVKWIFLNIVISIKPFKAGELLNCFEKIYSRFLQFHHSIMKAYEAAFLELTMLLPCCWASEICLLSVVTIQIRIL